MSSTNTTAQLKSLLRSGLATEEDRQRLWPKVALPIDEDEDHHQVAHRLCKLLKDTSLTSSCNIDQFATEGEYVLECRNRILTAIQRHKSISNATYLENITTIIVYTMKNLELSYYMLSTMIDQHNRYFFADGERRLYIMTETFKDMLASFIPRTYATLNKLRALQPHFLVTFFNDFFMDIFPTNILLNMLDSFLLEGVKILYRYGAAVICLYKSRIKSNGFATAEEFWATVKHEAYVSATSMLHAKEEKTVQYRMLPELLGLSPSLSILTPSAMPSAKSNRLVFSFSSLKQRAFDMERGLGSKLMRPLNISRNYLQRKHHYYYLQFDNPRGPNEDDDRRDAVVSSGGMARTESHAGLFTNDDDSPPPSPIPVRTVFKLPSNILFPEQIAALGAALPETSQWIRWTLRYSASKNGWDMSYALSLLHKKSPTLLLFYLQEPYEDTILGALHGDSISPVSPTQIRGQGSMNRVFVLNHGQLTCYPWVGLLQNQPGAAVSTSGTAATQRQLAVCAADFLAFGGSHEHFTNALRWEAADTSRIVTGHSDTYQNPPLLIPEVLSSGDAAGSATSHTYNIRDIEIFSGP